MLQYRRQHHVAGLSQDDRGSVRQGRTDMGHGTRDAAQTTKTVVDTPA